MRMMKEYNRRRGTPFSPFHLVEGLEIKVLHIESMRDEQLYCFMVYTIEGEKQIFSRYITKEDTEMELIDFFLKYIIVEEEEVVTPADFFKRAILQPTSIYKMDPKYGGSIWD